MLQVRAGVDSSEFHIGKRAGDIRDLQVKCVCESLCNNGWMRRLENKAKPVMLPLIRGEPSAKGETLRISPHDQRIIAAWASMKAMVAEYEGSVTTASVDRVRMMTKELPPEHGWRVWIGHFDRANWAPVWSANPFLISSDPSALGQKATYYNSQVSTQIIGHLFIQVIRSPATGFVDRWAFAGPAAGKLRCIWPSTSYSIVWPPPHIDDVTADYAVDAVIRHLEGLGRQALAHGSPGAKVAGKHV